MTNATENKTPSLAKASVAVAKAAKREKPAAKKAPAKAKPAKRTPATFTTVELAAELKMKPKTLRARMRRNIDQFENLFFEGQRHVFPDNKTTRNKLMSILG